MTLDPDELFDVRMPRGLTPRAQSVLYVAQTLALARVHRYVGVEHLLLALIDSGESVAS